MQETQVQSLAQEDPLEKEVTTYSSILAWRIPWTEETGGLWSMRSQRVAHNSATNTHTYTESGLEAMSLGSFLSSMFFTTCLSFLRSQFLNSQVPEM